MNKRNQIQNILSQSSTKQETKFYFNNKINRMLISFNANCQASLAFSCFKILIG